MPDAKVSDAFESGAPGSAPPSPQRTGAISVRANSSKELGMKARKGSKRRSSLALIANLQFPGPNGSTNESQEVKKDVDRARARVGTSRMNLRKLSLTPKNGDMESCRALTSRRGSIMAFANLELAAKDLFDLREEDGHKLGGEIVRDHFEKGKNSKLSAERMLQRSGALKAFVDGWKADGVKGTPCEWFIPMVETILENKPFNFRKNSFYIHRWPRCLAICFHDAKHKEDARKCKRKRRETRRTVANAASLHMANSLNTEASLVLGRKLGTAFTRSLFTCANAEAAVDEWFLQEPLLADIAQNFPWFLPMITAIGHTLLMKAYWGLWMRIGIIFVLNYLNIILDGIQIYDSLNSDEKTVGIIMVVFYFIQLVAKLILSSEQIKHSDKDDWGKTMDTLITALFLKPVTETYKIVCNVERESGEVFDPQILLMAEKQLDVTFGDIPVVFCQVVKMLVQKSSCGEVERDFSLLLNIILTFFLIGYNQSTITYYGDTDPVNRKRAPSFFGMVPDHILNRIATIALVCFFVSGFAAAKIVAYAFLFFHAPYVLVIVWFFANMGLYLVMLKFCLGSITTWHPSSGFVGTCVTRFVEYLTTSVAPLMLFRSPCGVGGRLWTLWVTFSFVQNFAMVFVADKFRDNHCLQSNSSIENIHTFNENGELSYIFTIGNIFVLLAGILLVQVLKKDYRKTFWELETTKDYIERVYWKEHAYEDEDYRNSLRCEAITVKEHLRPKAEDVKVWLDGWGEWEMEQPHWFEMNKELLLVNIDIDFLGSDWVREHFWESSDSFLKYTAATCITDGVRPPLIDIKRWISEIDDEIGNRSRIEGDHLPSWWPQRSLLFVINNLEPLQSWMCEEADVFQ